jgi:SAM-dependent methyltransferase
VGCGFGGTVAQLNEDHSGLDLVGVNIDARQIARAVATVQPPGPRATYTIAFLVGDACELPFADGSFDTLLAGGVHLPLPDAGGLLRRGAPRAAGRGAGWW